MFISNIEIIDSPKYFTQNKLIARYLINHGIPFLSYKNKTYYFSATTTLSEVLAKLPLYIKILSNLQKRVVMLWKN
jgi:hypothetical protein